MRRHRGRRARRGTGRAARYGRGRVESLTLAFGLACAVLLALRQRSGGDATQLSEALAQAEPAGARTGALLLVALVVVAVAGGVAKGWRGRKLERTFDRLTSGSEEMTPEEFLARHNELLAEGDFEGIYVLHNTTQDRYYVGQGRHVLSRLMQHFSGRGNGDVYADWKYGDSFTIRTIGLRGSGYESLNDFERDAIEHYDAYGSGYNRNRGIGA